MYMQIRGNEVMREAKQEARMDVLMKWKETKLTCKDMERHSLQLQWTPERAQGILVIGKPRRCIKEHQMKRVYRVFYKTGMKGLDQLTMKMMNQYEQSESHGLMRI
jgi:hypothetical protein